MIAPLQFRHGSNDGEHGLPHGRRQIHRFGAPILPPLRPLSPFLQIFFGFFGSKPQNIVIKFLELHKG